MIENKSAASKIRCFIIYFVILLLAFVCLVPLWNIVCISFSSSAAVAGNRVGMRPVQFTLGAYEKIIGDSQFWRSFGISVARVIIALALNLLLILLMAYPLSKSRREFRARNIYMYLLIFAMLFNGGKGAGPVKQYLGLDSARRRACFQRNYGDELLHRDPKIPGGGCHH